MTVPVQGLRGNQTQVLYFRRLPDHTVFDSAVTWQSDHNAANGDIDKFLCI